MRRRRWWPIVAVLPVVVATACYQDFDFGIDHKADRVIWASEEMLLDLATGTELTPRSPGAIPVPADWDGDHFFDPGIVLPNGDWITDSSAGTFNFPKPPELPEHVGSWTATILPVPADYDGDGTADAAWYRESDATWFIRGEAPVQFGSGPTQPPSPQMGVLQADYDFPVPADYDGDGIDDLAVYRPIARQWRVLESSSGTVDTLAIPDGYFVYPAPADYDGTGHAQRAIFGPDGWFIEGHPDVDPYGGWAETGEDTSFPAVADYDGDGRADLSVVVTSWTTEWRTKGSAETYEIDWTSEYPVATGYSANRNAGRLYFAARCALGYDDC